MTVTFYAWHHNNPSYHASHPKPASVMSTANQARRATGRPPLYAGMPGRSTRGPACIPSLSRGCPDDARGDRRVFQTHYNIHATYY